MSRPSMVTVTVVFFGASAGESDTGDLHTDLVHDRTTVLDVVLELVAEQLERRRQRGRGRRPQYADRRLARRPGEPGADVVGHVEQQVEIARAAVALDDPFEDALQPRGALATGRALAAALTGEEA